MKDTNNNISSSHPLSTMITYLQFGFVLTLIQIDIGWLKYITTSIGLLFIYLGLRLIKDINTPFHIAHQFSIVNLLIQVISLAILATPYYTNIEYLYFFGIALHFVMVYMIYLGLKEVSKDQESVKQFIWAYFILEVSLILGMFMWTYVFLLISLLVMGYLIYDLGQIKNDIFQYHIEESSMKVSSFKIVIIYCLSIIIFISSSFFLTTSFHYQRTNSSYGIDERFKDNKVEQTITYHDMKLKVIYAIVEREDIGCFQHIVQYEWEELPTYTYMLDTVIYPNIQGMAVTNQIVQHYVFDKEGMNYESKSETVMKEDFFQTTNVENLKTYINPFEPHMKGTIVFWVNDHYKETELQFPILFGLKNKFVFPYHEQYDQGIEIYALCEGIKIKDITTQDVYS